MVPFQAQYTQYTFGGDLKGAMSTAHPPEAGPCPHSVSQKLHWESLNYVHSEINFLSQDEKWTKEKPYRMRYKPPVGLPRTNYEVEPHVVKVHNVRPLMQDLSLDRNGFEVLQLNSELEYADFSNPQKIKDVYMEEVKNLLTQRLNAKHVLLLDYVVRKRHETFPISTGQEYEFTQPNTLAHIDVTLDTARNILRRLYPSLVDEITKSRVLCVTVWRPLAGPVKDWPLALCDAATLNYDAEIVPTDVVYEDFVAENGLMQYREAQMWFYLADQDSSEVLVFKAADSEIESACAHASFPLKDVTPGLTARESIDVRALVLFANVEGYDSAEALAF